MFASSV